MSLIDEALRRAQTESEGRLLREQGFAPLGRRRLRSGPSLSFVVTVGAGAVVLAAGVFAGQRWGGEVVALARSAVRGTRGAVTADGRGDAGRGDAVAQAVADTAKRAEETVRAVETVGADTTELVRGDVGVAAGDTSPALARPPSSAEAASVAGRPPSPSVAPGRPEGGGAAGTHIVATGETLWSLAQRYGVPVESLSTWNRLVSGAALSVGQELVIAGNAVRGDAAQPSTALGRPGPPSAAGVGGRVVAPDTVPRLGPPRKAEETKPVDARTEPPEERRPGVLEVRRRGGPGPAAARPARREEAERLFQEGVRLREIGDIEGAIVRYRRAIQMDSGYVAAYNDLGVLLHRAGRADDALDVLDAALALKPDYASALVNRGIILMEIGRYDAALEAFRTAVLRDAKNVNAYTNLGIVYKRLGRTDEARRVLETAVQIDPTNGVAHYNLARLLEAQGLVELAITHYSRFLESGAGSREVRIQVQEHVDRLRRYFRRP